MADEADFLQLLIASERVEGWLDIIRDGSNKSRLVQAAEELALAVDSKEAYAEEARLAGAVPVLTRLLKKTDDEHLLSLAADIIAACSGPMAVADKVRTFCYEGIPIVIREGALGDGVGAKIWTVAHTLCRELAAHPEIVRGQAVLEIGSGCGACGILAAKLGASQVVLTDYLEAILTNLRACVHLNAPAPEPSNGTAAAAGPGSGAVKVQGPAAGGAAGQGSDANGGSRDGQGPSAAQPSAAECEVGQLVAEGPGDELFDPEDASECSDLDDFFAEAAAPGRGGTAAGQGQQGQSWDVGVMQVRFLDWSESVAYLQQAGVVASSSTAPCPAAGLSSPAQRGFGSPLRRSGDGDGAGAGAGADPGTGGGAGSTAAATLPAPGVGPEERFPVILGTDILYEWPMVEMVACVLKHRLAPGGRAMLCCAVREQAMFDAFAARLRELGFRLGMTPVQPHMDDGGILGKERDYEGGFVMVAAEHAAAPCSS